jgi:hypothetical protein
MTAPCLTCQDLQVQSQNSLATRRSGVTRGTQSGPAACLNERLFGHLGGSTLPQVFLF